MDEVVINSFTLLHIVPRHSDSECFITAVLLETLFTDSQKKKKNPNPGRYANGEEYYCESRWPYLNGLTPPTDGPFVWSRTGTVPGLRDLLFRWRLSCSVAKDQTRIARLILDGLWSDRLKEQRPDLHGDDVNP